YDGVRLASQQRQGVVAVRGLLDGESLFFEVATVGGEAVHLVIHPEDGLGTGHRRGNLGESGARPQLRQPVREVFPSRHGCKLAHPALEVIGFLRGLGRDIDIVIRKPARRRGRGRLRVVA
ncbi:MAG: hypothetical protein ACREJ4_00740, partial [Candidatus Methylomirabilaceae bacterium]